RSRRALLGADLWVRRRRSGGSGRRSRLLLRLELPKLSFQRHHPVFQVAYFLHQRSHVTAAGRLLRPCGTTHKQNKNRYNLNAAHVNSSDFRSIGCRLLHPELNAPKPAKAQHGEPEIRAQQVSQAGSITYAEGGGREKSSKLRATSLRSIQA